VGRLLELKESSVLLKQGRRGAICSPKRGPSNGGKGGEREGMVEEKRRLTLRKEIDGHDHRGDAGP